MLRIFPRSNSKKSPAHQYAGERGRRDISEDSTREFIECIDDYSAVGQPLSDKTLKDILVSKRGLIHKEIMSMVPQIRWVVDGMGERIHHVENKMGDFEVTHNELVDAHNEAKSNQN